MKTNHPKLDQKQITKQMRFSNCTIKRSRNDMNMKSLYKKMAAKPTVCEANINQTRNRKGLL